jgi:hypothetical protein
VLPADGGRGGRRGSLTRQWKQGRAAQLVDLPLEEGEGVATHLALSGGRGRRKRSEECQPIQRGGAPYCH